MSGPFGSNQFFGVSASDPAYVPKGSIWFDRPNSYLSRTPSSAGNRRTFSLSCWIKLSTIDTNQAIWDAAPSGEGNEDVFMFRNDNIPEWMSAGYDYARATPQVLRDPTAWYHILMVIDSTNTVVSQRALMYINGKPITNAAGNTMTLNAEAPYWNNTNLHSIGTRQHPTVGTDYRYGSYLSEAIHLDGYAAIPSDFGKYDSNGVWIPVDPTDLVTANKGTNGFWLDFADSSDLGNDVSGNNNDWALTGLSSTNATADRCADEKEDTGNYPIFNPLIPNSSFAYSEGNLKSVGTTSASHQSTLTTTAVYSGKWYYEHTATAMSGAPSEGYYVGVQPASGAGSLTEHLGDNADSFAYTDTGQKCNNNTFASYGDTFAAGDVIGVALDLDNGKIFFSKNGTWQNSGDPANGGNAAYTSLSTTTGYIPAFSVYNTGTAKLNFGQTAFSYTPPSGFKKLNTSNMSAPTVTNGKDNFLPIVYEGNGTGQRVGNFIPFTDSHTVNYSARFDGAADYLSFNPTASATGQKTFTISAWIKKNDSADYQSIISATDGTARTSQLGFGTSGGGGTDNLIWFYNTENNVGQTTTIQVSGTSSWNHILLNVDTTQATNTNRVKIYLNGVQQTLSTFNSNGDGGWPQQNDATQFCVSSTYPHRIGSYNATGAYLNAYMSEFVFIDSTAYGPSSFGQTDTSTNRWIPKDVSGLTFGTNGAYLNFADKNDLGDDESGEGNDFTEYGFDTTNGSNQMYDTPTRSFDTFNPAGPMSTAGGLTMGNLKATGTPDNTGVNVIPANGKFYWEVLLEATAGTAKDAVGVMTVDRANTGSYGIGSFLYAKSGETYGGSAWTSGKGWAAYVAGDVIGIYYNAGSLTFYRNGTSQGTVNFFNGSSDVVLTVQGENASTVFVLNTGQWIYFDGATTTLDASAGGYFQQTSLPTDSKALQQDNYDSSAAGITGLAWFKDRTDNSTNYLVWDRVNSIYKYLISNTSDVQGTDTNGLKRFLQQGAEVGNMSSLNDDGNSMVLWQWAANGTGTTNSDGSGADVTVSANATAGFSIVKYVGDDTSGRTIGTGLTAQPAFILIKNMDNSGYDWQVYHKSVGNTASLSLNINSGPSTSSTYWNDTSPATSTPFVFSLGNSVATNKASDDFIAYVWAEIAGYSQFGEFTGNNSTNGPFISLSFAPSYFMFKRTDGNGDWYVMDTTRSTYNPANAILAYNNNSKENWMGTPANFKMDFLSNGIKIRSTNGSDFNGSGAEFIYAAFASNPFGGSGVNQAKAR